MSDFVRNRHMIVALSALGMAAMTAVTLRQFRVIRHLPDPPLPGFDSDKVNTSSRAQFLGLPDGPVSLASFAANLPLALAGGPDRARETPLLPIASAAKAGVEAAVAAWYFYQMPAKEHAWCAYCIASALANWGIFAASLPEARAAAVTLASRNDFERAFSGQRQNAG